ncbi:hypothetical protein [Kaarinaea lacus]
MRSYFNFVPVYVLLFVLSGCQPSTSDSGPPVTTSTVNSFEVVGNTVDQDARIVLPLLPNNATVSGNFDLLWDVISSDPYTIEVYISSNSILDPTDTLFLRMQCGSDNFEFICEQIGEIACGIAYEPDYEMTELLDENNEIVVDVNGDPIMVPAKDPVTGYFIVLEDHYYLRCADGPATVRLAEITDRVTGFPFGSTFIFKACATDELLCPEVPIDVQFYDSQP